MPNEPDVISRPDETDPMSPWTSARLFQAVLYGGPLVVMGGLWIAGALKLSFSQPIAYIFLFFGGCYLFSGLGLFTRWKSAAATAIVAWVLAVLAFPVRILLPLMPAPFAGISATPVLLVLAGISIYGLLRWNPPARPWETDQSGSGFASVAAALFCEEFGAHSKKDGTPLSLRNDLVIPAGRLSQFLQNLRLDYRLPVSEADAPVIDSLSDLLALLKERQDRL